MQKIIRNTTLSGILVQDTGVHIDSGESYTIDTQTYLLWANSIDIVGYINSGDLVVNNGTVDLTINDGIRFLQYADRLDISLNGTTLNRVTASLDFQGSVSVSSDNNGKAIVNVTAGSALPSLREVTYILLGGSVPMSVESNLLFEPDPINDVILFLREEVL
jgi:hypothetical protein